MPSHAADGTGHLDHGAHTDARERHTTGGILRIAPWGHMLSARRGGRAVPPGYPPSGTLRLDGLTGHVPEGSTTLDTDDPLERVPGACTIICLRRPSVGR